MKRVNARPIEEIKNNYEKFVKDLGVYKDQKWRRNIWIQKG